VGDQLTLFYFNHGDNKNETRMSAPEVLLESENVADPGTSLLLLFLRLNDTGARLDPSVCWEYLTLREMYHVRLLSKTLNRDLARVEYNRCHDMRDYVIPHPGYPGVLSTPSDVQAGAGLYTHQLASLEAMHQAENRNFEFGSLRGGILGDAPGLGKTITMLAHIASTAGLRPKEPAEFYDEESLLEGWKSMRTNPVFTTEIIKALKPVRHWVEQNGSKNVIQTFRDLAEFVRPPYQDDRLLTLQDFERHVRRTLAPVVPLAEMELFRQNVRKLKAGLDKRKRSYFLSEKGKRLVFERDLMPCSSTLIIVPDVLMEHWAEQIRRHLNLEVFAEANNGVGSQGVIYIDGVGDLAKNGFSLNNVSLQKMMAPASHLMRHMIVVVTFSRCQQEYEKELTAGRMQTIGNAHTNKRRREALMSPSYGAPSPLLQLRWFRLIVDEGHELGTHEVGRGVTRLINELAAERRWVLSGTPTTGDEDSEDFTSNGLDQLQRLLLFLRHPLYGTVPSPAGHQGSGILSKSNQDQAREEWTDRVKVPFLRKNENGRTELFRVLSEVMVMHRKEDIDLEKPIFKQGEVDVPIPNAVQSMLVNAAHINTNEELAGLRCMSVLVAMGVDARRRGRNVYEKLKNAFYRNDKNGICNILLSEYMSTDQYQSLVDEAQGRYIIESVQRERLLRAEGGGPDQRTVKAVVYSRSNQNLQSVSEHLYHGFVQENIAELYAGRIGDMSSELSRFRNGCKQGRECPICCRWNDVGGSARCGNRLMEVTDAENRRFLVEPERVIRALGYGEWREIPGNVEPTRLGGEPLTKYSLNSKHWKVGDVLEIDVRDPHPLLPARWSVEEWAKHGSEKCIQLAEKDNWGGRDWFFGPLPIYEDYRDRVVVRLAKWQPCSRFHNPSRWYKGPLLAHAPMETVEEDVFVLCLDAQLSSGLDLSFVTHMFLLEPIDDAALLEQVTSRAYRLGATGPVVIETVNVWEEMDIATTEDSGEASWMMQEREKRSGTAVCEHCFRSFESLEKAENHETKCDRNPDSTVIVDPYHLSSVYRDIRPPRPLNADSGKDDATCR
jgi:SNF2 family DNA or RNA helicase